MVIFLTLLHWWAKWWGVKCSAMMNSYLELPMSGKGSHGVTCLPQSPLYNLRMACGRGCKYLIGKNWKTFLETSAGQCTKGNVSKPAYALNISNIKGGGACSVLSHTCIKWKWLVGMYVSKTDIQTMRNCGSEAFLCLCDLVCALEVFAPAVSVLSEERKQQIP